MTRTKPTDLKLINGAVDYLFTIAPKSDTGGRMIQVQTRPWEPGDPRSPWRVSLLPGDGGLSTDRLHGSGLRRTYSAGPADPTHPDMLVPGPARNTLAFTSQDAPAEKILEVAGERFTIKGRYCFKVSAAMVVSTEKDFGAGKSAVDATVFNGEIVVAMGPTEKIWTRDSAGTWTQATDNTFAEAVGTVGSLMWRAEKGTSGGTVAYLLSNCTTAPRTLASYAPSTDANKYRCGDGTYPVLGIYDYGGKIHCGKADGMWAVGLNLTFVNITPQLARFPHVNNTKGTFTAWGYLFVPSAMGLIRVKQGAAVIRGPEISDRPGYKTWARAGVQVNEDVFLLVTDEGATSNTAVYKMSRDMIGSAPDGHEYIYHHILDAGSAKGYAISASADSTGGLGQPSILVTQAATVGYWFRLAWGTGRYIDDSLYQFSSSMSYTTGEILPQNDLTVHSVLVGVELLLKLNATNAYTMTMDYKLNDEAAWYPMLSTQEGGGRQAIDYLTFSGYQSVIRYAQREHQQGQFFNFRLTGTGSTSAGVNRPEIREIWAFGFSRPRMLDAFTIGIIADGKSRTANAQAARLSTSETSRILRQFMNEQTVLEMVLPDYEVKGIVRVMVTGVQEEELDGTIGTGGRVASSRLIKLDLVRVDFADRFALP